MLLQLLGEFAALCGPFSRVLETIRDELVRLPAARRSFVLLAGWCGCQRRRRRVTDGPWAAMHAPPPHPPTPPPPRALQAPLSQPLLWRTRRCLPSTLIDTQPSTRLGRWCSTSSPGLWWQTGCARRTTACWSSGRRSGPSCSSRWAVAGRQLAVGGRLLEEISAQLLEQVGGGWVAAGSGWQVT